MVPSSHDPARARLLLLTAVLFVSYLCVAIPLPIVPVFVIQKLGLGNAWAGLGVGTAFLATIVTRGYAGSLSDRRGAKLAVVLGLALYALSAAVSMVAGFLAHTPLLAFAVLVAGRLLLGLGESLVGVGVIAWGVGLVSPSRSGEVLSLVGVAIYGALGLGGPLGLVLIDRLGYAGAMGASAALPCLGLLVVCVMHGVVPTAGVSRPPIWQVMQTVWLHGVIVCLQGVGFAAIGAFFVLDFVHRGWSNAGLGLTAFGGGFVLVRLLLGRLPDRVGGLRVAIGSLAVETIGQLLIWSAGDPAFALAGAFLTGIGCSMVFPAMGREVVQLVAPHLRGTALGGFTAFQDVAYGLTGPVAGLLADRAGYGSVFLMGGAAAAAGFLIASALLSRNSRQKAQSNQ